MVRPVSMLISESARETMQPPRTLCRIAFALSAVRVFAPPLFAESFDARHAHDLAGNPGDLHFRVETADGRRAFHSGERIPLALLFSSDAPDKYKLNGATYERSGRLPTEEFVSERENVPDPYQDYFGTGVLGGIAGGLRGYPVLESKPYKIELDLNDWFRFDLPGQYRFYLKSHRLTREREPGEPGGRTVDFAAVSNIFEVEILPEDAVWSSAKLGEIRAVLSRPEPEQPQPGGPPIPYDRLEDEIALARRELRFLATIDAVRLSLEDARKPGHDTDTLLLIGARDRQKTVAAFEDYLTDPSVGFREWDIRVRALFTLLQKETLKPLAFSMWNLPAGSELQQLRNIVEARQKRFEEIVREEAVRLIPVAAAKEAEPRKVSAEAIASIVPDAARSARLVPPYDYGLSREELIAQFPRFPTEQQEEILISKWDLVRGPEMIPALRQLIDQAEPTPFPASSMPLTVWGADAGIAQDALRRLLELSPQEAARILRKDIATGAPRFASFEVLEFPPQDIPEADEPFSGLLKKNPHAVLPLVARFATAGLAGQMRELYLSRSWICSDEKDFLAFFVRTAPAEDGGQGNDLLKRAMANRENRGCYRMLLHRIASVTWNPAIESQAIATLDDPDPAAAASAARVLSSYGSTAVEPYLWKRLERWSETWRGRAQELAGHPITGRVPDPESQLGSALFDSIATAQSWVLDEPRRKRLAAMCVDESCKEVWGKESEAGEISVEASSGGSLYPTAFRVEGYSASTLDALKRKLQQYPAGTAFRWCPQAGNPSDKFSPGQRDDMYRDLAAFLSKRSMNLEPYVEEKCVPGAPGK